MTRGARDDQAASGDGEATDYDTVEEAILGIYEINEEMARKLLNWWRPSRPHGGDRKCSDLTRIIG